MSLGSGNSGQSAGRDFVHSMMHNPAKAASQMFEGMAILADSVRHPERYDRTIMESVINSLDHKFAVRSGMHQGMIEGFHDAGVGVIHRSSDARRNFKDVFAVSAITRIKFFQHLQSLGLDTRFAEVCRDGQSYVPYEFKSQFMKWHFANPPLEDSNVEIVREPASQIEAAAVETIAPAAEPEVIEAPGEPVADTAAPVAAVAEELQTDRTPIEAEAAATPEALDNFEMVAPPRPLGSLAEVRTELQSLHDIVARPHAYRKAAFETFVAALAHRVPQLNGFDARKVVREVEALSNQILSTDILTRETFFKAIRTHGLEEQFAALCHDRHGFIPRDTRQQFLAWQALPPAVEAPAEENATTEQVAEVSSGEIGYVEIEGFDLSSARREMLDTSASVISKTVNMDGIAIVEVNHALVVPGEQDVLGPIEIAETGNGNNEPRPQPRRDILLAHLLANGVLPKDIIVYTEKSSGVDAEQASAKKRFPYEIVEYDHDGVYAQVALRNCTKFATYVIKNPVDIGPDTVIKLSDLKENPSAFKVVFVSPEQWTGRIDEILRTDIGALPAQVKHNILWHGRKDAFENSLIAHIITKGRLPHPKDNTPIEDGALAGITTWSRAANALRRDHISGLEGMKTFQAVYERLAERLLVLSSFLKAQPIEASAVFYDASRMVEQHGEVPQRLLFDDMNQMGIKLAGRDPQAVDLAFAFGAVRNSYTAQSLEDYMLHAGIGERAPGGELRPVDYN
jgi:hypothetical protein